MEGWFGSDRLVGISVVRGFREVLPVSKKNYLHKRSYFYRKTPQFLLICKTKQYTYDNFQTLCLFMRTSEKFHFRSTSTHNTLHYTMGIT